MSDRETNAADRFKCTLRERAVFESGIKLATIYHQFVGSPVCSSNVRILEESIEKTIMVQPYVSNVKVRIDDSKFMDGDEYDYFSLTGDMIDAVVEIRIDNVIVTAEMRYDEELKYPLMFISKISE